MAINGLLKSSSDSMLPVARNRLRCGARSAPFLMTSERMVKSFRTLTRTHYTRFQFHRQPPIAAECLPRMHTNPPEAGKSHHKRTSSWEGKTVKCEGRR